MKYFVFSIDDGTVFDNEVVNLFNKYGIKATFNLNSGLQDFVWYRDDVPIRRLNLYECKSIYDGHEIASHSLTHPYLDQCPDDIVRKEVGEDIYNLENIFGKKVVGFATPFHTSGEREVAIVKEFVQYIRLSDIDESFQYPNDNYHYKITAMDIDRALFLIDKFIKDDNAKIFIFAAHGYDFFLNNTFDKLEHLIKILRRNKNTISVLPLKDIF